jgi:hypothetical protein
MVRKQKKHFSSSTPTIRFDPLPRHAAFRKASNREVIMEAFAKRDQVGIRISLSVQTAGGQYLGFNKQTIKVIAQSVEEAEAFPARLTEAVKELVGRLGMQATLRNTPL